jgi:hypothetical protein
MLKGDTIFFLCIYIYIAPNDEPEKHVEGFFTSSLAHMNNNYLNLLKLFNLLHSYLKILLAVLIAIAI